MVTLKDIAEKAGTSVSTVSLVLSGNERISTATREKVLRIAHELGYRKDRRQQTPTLAIVLTDKPGGPVSNLFQEAVLGVLDETMASSAVLQILRYDAQCPDPRQLLLELRTTGSHGAIMIGQYFPETAIRALRNVQYPHLFIGSRSLPDAELDWVASDYAQGARLATQHLLNLGHGKIAALRRHMPSYTRYEERLLGYRMAIEEAGCAPLIFTTDGNDLPVRQMLEQGVTAVFTLSYIHAAKLLTACHALGIAVPQQLAIVAFDDHPSAHLLSVPLTTIRQPLHELGVLAARTVLAWLRGAPRTLVQIRVQTQLIVRDSCGANLKQADQATVTTY
jgi:LacI family transcriptional regulator